MLAKLAWVNGHLAHLTAPERFVLEAIVATPSALPVARVIPRAVSGLSFGLGRPESEISIALVGLSRADVLHWDNSGGIALMPELWRSQQNCCQSPNHLRGWFYGWQALPRNSPLTYAALVAVRRLVPRATETVAFARAWMQTFARPLFEYLRWGGLGVEEARRFAGVVTVDELATLPRVAASAARRQADFKRRRRGLPTERELHLPPELTLPADWRGGIAPRFAVSGAATGPLACDLTLGQGSARPEVGGALCAAPREAGLLGGVDGSRLPVRSEGEGERDLDPKSLSLYLQKEGNDWVTTDGARAPNSHGEAESGGRSLSGQSAHSGNDWVTTDEVTTESRLRQSLPSRYRPAGGGSPETQEGNTSKHGAKPGLWAEQIGPDGKPRPPGRVKLPWHTLIGDKKLAREFAAAFNGDSAEPHPGARAEQAGGARARAEGRRPRGVAPPPSAGALAALSGWPERK